VAIAVEVKENPNDGHWNTETYFTAKVFHLVGYGETEEVARGNLADIFSAYSKNIRI